MINLIEYFIDYITVPNPDYEEGKHLNTHNVWVYEVKL